MKKKRFGVKSEIVSCFGLCIIDNISGNLAQTIRIILGLTQNLSIVFMKKELSQTQIYFIETQTPKLTNKTATRNRQVK